MKTAKWILVGWAFLTMVVYCCGWIRSWGVMTTVFGGLLVAAFLPNE